MPDLRARALKFLSRREHASHELRQKLAPFAASVQELETLLAELQAGHLLSDQRYASQRVGSRSCRYGNQRLAEELRARGVDGDCIATALAESGDEFMRCRAVHQKKFAAWPESAEERLRQMRFLLQRGFSSDVVRQVLRGEAE